MERKVDFKRNREDGWRFENHEKKGKTDWTDRKKKKAIESRRI